MFRYYIAAPIVICVLGAIAEIAGVGDTTATYGVYAVALVALLAMLHREPRVRRSPLSTAHKPRP